MDTVLIFRIAGIGMVTAVVCQILSRSGKDDQALLLSVAGIVVVFIMIMGKMGELFDSIGKVFGL